MLSKRWLTCRKTRCPYRLSELESYIVLVVVLWWLSAGVTDSLVLSCGDLKNAASLEKSWGLAENVKMDNGLSWWAFRHSGHSSILDISHGLAHARSHSQLVTSLIDCFLNYIVTHCFADFCLLPNTNDPYTHPPQAGLHCTDSCCQRASCATYGWDPYPLLHERLSTDSARLRTMQLHWDDLKSIAQQELTLSIFHTMRSLIKVVFITSHLVYYSTMTSLDL